MGFITKMKKMFSADPEVKRAKITADIRSHAEKRAVKTYNIKRIDGVDYITYAGVPISMPDDAAGGSLLDRLEGYRHHYVNTCVEMNDVIGDSNWNRR